MRRTILFSLICLVLSACDMPAVRETQAMPSLTTETSVAPSRAAPTSTKLTPLRAPATSASSTPGASTTSQLSLDPSSGFGALESEGRLPIVYKELVSIDQVAFTADRKAMYFELHWSFLRYPVGPGDVTTWPPFTDCRLRLAPEEGTTITYFQVGKADSLLEPPDMTAWAGDLAVPIVKKKFPKLGKVLEIASTLVGLYDVFKPLFKAPEAYTAIDATMPAAGYFTQLVSVDPNSVLGSFSSRSEGVAGQSHWPSLPQNRPIRLGFYPVLGASCSTYWLYWRKLNSPKFCVEIVDKVADMRQSVAPIQSYS